MKKTTYCLTITTPPERSDALVAFLAGQGFMGCHESSENGTVHLTAHYTTEVDARAAAQRITATFADIVPSIDRIEPQDWNARWRESMRPARIARGWYVAPLWLPPPASCRHWIKIEPKMAFGTGHHETTRLAAQAIIGHRRQLRGKHLLDVGCGSGVLCFVADACGAAFCLGVEIDPECRENIAENLRNNPARGVVAFAIGSTNGLRQEERFDAAVMNMILTESAPQLPALKRLLKPAGLLIWSGILCVERKKVIALAQRLGFALTAEQEENEWWCGVFEQCGSLSPQRSIRRQGRPPARRF